MVSVPNISLVSNIHKFLSHAEETSLFHICPGTFNKIKRQWHTIAKLVWECVHAQLLSCVWLFAPHGPTRLLCPRDFPGKKAGVGCHFLLQGIFLTQGSDSSLLPFLLHCRQVPCCWATRKLSKSRPVTGEEFYPLHIISLAYLLRPTLRNSLVVQWLGPSAFTAGDLGSIPEINTSAKVHTRCMVQPEKGKQKTHFKFYLFQKAFLMTIGTIPAKEGHKNS